jgi:phage baseplate assembly protein W
MAYEINIPVITPNVAVGIKLPFSRKNGGLFDLSYSDEEQAISNLKNLILTRTGERIMEPFFGTNLQDSLFEQSDDSLISSIRESISTSIDFWLPYITIVKLDILPVVSVSNTAEEHGVTISMIVSVNNNDKKIPITFLVTSSAIEEL